MIYNKVSADGLQNLIKVIKGHYSKRQSKIKRQSFDCNKNNSTILLLSTGISVIKTDSGQIYAQK